MSRRDPPGAFEAVGRRRRAGLPAPRHLLRRSRRRVRRSVPLRPRAHRFRSASVRRRHASPRRSRSSARTASRSDRPPACISPSGRRTPSASAWSATSTAGTAACTRCGCCCRTASGSSSFPISRTARNTSSRSARRQGALLKKSDPFGVAFEVPPRSASVVRDISGYQWRDDDWMTARAEQRRLAGSSDDELRSASRLVVARAGGGQSLSHLSRAGRTASCRT